MLVGYAPQRHRQLYDLLMLRRSRRARLWSKTESNRPLNALRTGY